MKPFCGSFGLAVFLLVGSAASQAAVITANSVTTSAHSGTYGTAIGNVINGSGLSGPVTDVNYTAVKHALGYSPTIQWVDADRGNTSAEHITFGFAKPKNIDQILIWNYTQSSSTNRGIKTFDIQVNTGSGFSTIASTTINAAPYVYAEHKPQVIDIGMQSGVQQLRFWDVTNQGSTTAIGLDEVWFRNSSYQFGVPAPGFVGTMGNDTTTDRATAGDSGSNVFWTHAYGAPVAGTVGDVTLRFQGQTGSFELFHLRPTGAANQYHVIARSGSITPSGTSGEELTYAFPGGTGAATAFHLQPGDMLGHYGNGLASTLNSNTVAAHNNQHIYSLSNAPAVNTTFALSGGGQRRDYAWSVDLPGFVENVGNGAGKAGTPDTGTRFLIVLDHDPFTKPGKLSTWQWFNDTAGTGGRKLTPVLLRNIGSTLTAIGIGTTRIGDVNGFQHYAFDLVSGTNLVEPDDLFGFYYGDSTGESHAGSVQYLDLQSLNQPDMRVRLFSDTNGVQLGDTYTNPAHILNRWYSINASTIPEPGAWLLLLSALACGLLVRRAR